MRRRGRSGLIVLGAATAAALAFPICPPTEAAAVPAAGSGALIVRRSASAADLTDALQKRVESGGTPARVVELSGDLIADTARLSRESRGRATIFAIGPDATDAAGSVSGPAVVSLGVPNPARLRTAGTYLSMYPKLERVFAYLRSTLGAARVGFLFSPPHNREIALAFMRAADAHGITLEPIPATTSGDLVREFGRALAKVDVVVLAVDPLLFDRQSLKLILDLANAAKKPTVGFLDELPRLGVTVSLVPPAAAVADLAAQVAQERVTVGKKRVEVDGAAVIVSRRGAERLSLDPEALGANRID